MSRIKAPCHNCEDRYVGCHSKCDKYKKYKTEYEKQKESIRKGRNDLFWVHKERK